MSGAGVQVAIEGLEELQGRLHALKSWRTHDLLSGIGAMLESQTKHRISSEKSSPGGQKWQPWSDAYAKTRHGGQSLLQNENNLLESIQFIVSGGQVEVGTNLVYGAVHQYGFDGKNYRIPQREYLGLSPENEADVVQLVHDFLDGLLSNGKRS